MTGRIHESERGSQPVFDPYHKWLGIAPKDQSLNPGRLATLRAI